MADLVIGLLQIAAGFVVFVGLTYYIGWNNGYDKGFADGIIPAPCGHKREHSYWKNVGWRCPVCAALADIDKEKTSG